MGARDRRWVKTSCVQSGANSSVAACYSTGLCEGTPIPCECIPPGDDFYKRLHAGGGGSSVCGLVRDFHEAPTWPQVHQAHACRSSRDRGLLQACLEMEAVTGNGFQICQMRIEDE